MGNKFIIRSTCDRCGDVLDVENGDGGFPPVGWYALQLTERKQGHGWSNSLHTDSTICDKCALLVKQLLAGKKTKSELAYAPAGEYALRYGFTAINPGRPHIFNCQSNSHKALCGRTLNIDGALSEKEVVDAKYIVCMKCKSIEKTSKKYS